MIRDRAGPDRGRRVPRRARAAPRPRRVAALRDARAIIIGPSNPVLSIDPILAVLGDEVRAAQAPGGRRLAARARPGAEGPDRRLPGLGRAPLDSDGIADHYAGLIDGLVADQRAEHVPTLETDVDLNDPEARRRVARDVLEFAAALA